MSDRPNPALISPPAAPSALPYPPVVEHLLKRYSLLSRQLAQSAHNGWTSAALLPFSTGPQTWQELFQLQQVVLQQVEQLHQGWLSGWTAWLGEFAQLKRVNTMSKLVEQEFNLAAQFVLLLQGQATDWTSLQENIEVNYGYWLSEKLNSQQGSMAAVA